MFKNDQNDSVDKFSCSERLARDIESLMHNSYLLDRFRSSSRPLSLGNYIDSKSTKHQCKYSIIKIIKNKNNFK
jgi:hypothetical protein